MLNFELSTARRAFIPIQRRRTSEQLTRESFRVGFSLTKFSAFSLQTRLPFL
jgi:hypothetical protein